MKNLEKIFTNPKVAILIGLIMSIIYLIPNTLSLWKSFYIHIAYAFIISNIYVLGLIIYYVTVFLRIKKIKISINIVQKILILSFIIQSIIASYLYFYCGYNNFLVTIINIVYFLTCALYFYELFNKNCRISNKVFLIVTFIKLIFSIYTYSLIKRFTCISTIEILIYAVINLLFFISTIPYFYNYYNLKKGCEKNGQGNTKCNGNRYK